MPRGTTAPPPTPRRERPPLWKGTIRSKAKSIVVKAMLQDAIIRAHRIMAEEGPLAELTGRQAMALLPDLTTIHAALVSIQTSLFPPAE